MTRDMERRMAYNGMFAGEWMPHGPAGGATSSSSQQGQHHQPIKKYSHITRIIDMTRSWREYTYTHQEYDDGMGRERATLGDGST